MNKQQDMWETKFGEEYTKRNLMKPLGIDQQYFERYGITRKSMNNEFLDFLDRKSYILEVGSNIGNQLNLLSDMGFENLYGIEINHYAINISKEVTLGLPIHVIKASALDIPFKDNFFDLVFTSGVLIHIDPKDIKKALSEIHRCSKHYIWGFEYFSDDYKEVKYRGRSNMLWKTDFKKLFLENFSDLTLKKEKLFTYIENRDLKDQMYLLKKGV